MKAIVLILALLFSATFQADAEQFGLFTYAVTGGEVIITDYSEDATGHVEIPAEIEGLPVTTIGGPITRWGWNSAFSGCTELTSVSIPGSVKHIGTAFLGCSGLTELFIAEGVESMGSGAFRGCTSLTRVSIPSSVIQISLEVARGGNEYAFANCNQLAEIVVAAGNPSYASVDGVLFDAGVGTLLSFPLGKAGDYTIPEGVTTIRDWAFPGDSRFPGNTKLTSISLPSSVTNLGSDPFQFDGCRGLTSIVVDPGNASFSSANGVLFNAEMTNLIRFPLAKAGSYVIPEGIISIDHAFSGCSGLSKISIPAGVTSLEEGTFGGCSALSSVLIPASVTSIEGYAFADCRSLTSAVFLGDSPPFFDPFAESFEETATFTIYYLPTSTGFTSPTWKGYPAVMLDDATYPAAPWLVSHGLPQDTDLNQDLNDDGVSLLMAYALDLDPNQNLRGSLPVPVLDDNTLTLTLTFPATAPGVTYTVETSTDLQNWVEEGVVISNSGPPRHRTASVPLDAPRRYLRLVVVAEFQKP